MSKLLSSSVFKRVQIHWERKNLLGIFLRKLFYYEKCTFKASGKLLFSLFIINQYCTKNMYSNWVGGCVLVYSSLISIVHLIFYYKKCVFKASGRLLFSYSSLISIICLKCFTTNFIKLLWKDTFKIVAFSLFL